MKKTPTTLILGLFSALLCFLPLTVMAEDESPPLAEMWLITTKTGQDGAFRAALKEHMAVREQHGDPWNWQTYTVSVGKNIGQVAIRYCCINWADVDSYNQWSEDNPDVPNNWAQTVDQHVAKYEHYFEQVDWDNSHWAEGSGPFRYFGVTEWTIKGGHNADFVAAREKMSQIAINQGWASADRNWIWTTSIGGKASQSIIVPYKNYADMAPGEQSFFEFLVDHLGSEEAAGELMNTFSSATQSTEYTVWELQPDLSMNEDE